MVQGRPYKKRLGLDAALKEIMRATDELQQRVKVPRNEVRGILARSLLACPVPFLWRKLYVPSAKAVASGGEFA